jgi:uncharacterized protein (DUF58 family)
MTSSIKRMTYLASGNAEPALAPNLLGSRRSSVLSAARVALFIDERREAAEQKLDTAIARAATVAQENSLNEVEVLVAGGPEFGDAARTWRDAKANVDTAQARVDLFPASIHEHRTPTSDLQESIGQTAVESGVNNAA